MRKAHRATFCIMHHDTLILCAPRFAPLWKSESQTGKRHCNAMVIECIDCSTVQWKCFVRSTVFVHQCMSMNDKEVFSFFYRRTKFCKLFTHHHKAVGLFSAAHTGIFYISGAFGEARNYSERTHCIWGARHIHMELFVRKVFCGKASYAVMRFFKTAHRT